MAELEIKLKYVLRVRTTRSDYQVRKSLDPLLDDLRDGIAAAAEADPQTTRVDAHVHKADRDFDIVIYEA